MMTETTDRKTDGQRPLVSVIVPVYKAEAYLDACVRSILGQSYPELEVILVDDGSPDGCPALCDRCAQEDGRVHVIHQKNMGLGLSRNSGMAAARGIYLLFVDADDCLDGADAVRLMVEKAESARADITVGNYRRFHGDEVMQVNRHHLSDSEDTRSVEFRFKGFYQYGHLAHNWGQLYRRDFLYRHELWCRAYPFTQDKAHNMSCYVYEPKYAFLEESIYLYRVNEDSVTFRYKERLTSVWISIASDFLDFLRERGIEDSYGDWTAFHLFFGSFFLVKQELAAHGVRAGVRAVRSYGREPLVQKSMRALAKGQYVKEIKARSWRFMIQAAALLFSMRAYLLFVLGIWMLRMAGVDEHITAKRNKREHSHGEHTQ